MVVSINRRHRSKSGSTSSKVVYVIVSNRILKSTVIQMFDGSFDYDTNRIQKFKTDQTAKNQLKKMKDRKLYRIQRVNIGGRNR